MPRWIDYGLATLGLLLLTPWMLLIAAAIRCTSYGPVLFRQARIGRNGKVFEILKFRTMSVDSERRGKLTVGEGDPRITGLGRFLRKCKLDELPQLLNVLRGEMRLVGPRPEVPEYIRLYDEIQRAVLMETPGITDPASILFRDEDALLARAPDPERFYIEDILPRKLELNARYIEDRNGWRDVGVIAETVKKAVLRV